ncbi:hypothetical protein KEM55_007823, partial [Ascosphaera atra]
MFLLPGAPRQQQVDPARLQAFIAQPAPLAPNGGNVAPKPSNARQAKRLFIENIPSEVTEDGMVQFFNLQLNGLNVITEVDPCVSAQFSKDKKLGMAEFRTNNDATVALAFDGIMMEEHSSEGSDSRGLSLRRPRDYIVPPTEPTPYEEGVVS